AVSVWMQIHKDEPVKGVALLKQEADKTKDPAARQRLGRRHTKRSAGAVRLTKLNAKQRRKPDTRRARWPTLFVSILKLAGSPHLRVDHISPSDETRGREVGLLLRGV